MQPFVLEHLQNACKNHPDKNAVIYRESPVSYSELDRLSNRIAVALDEAGVRPGDKIGLYLEKSILAPGTNSPTAVPEK